MAAVPSPETPTPAAALSDPWLPFAGVLAAYRQRRGWTQTRLGQVSSVAPSYLSRIELGQRLPDDAVAESLAEALGLDAAEGDRLCWAAGLLPPRLTRLPPGDRTVLAVVGVLTAARVAPRRRAEFRRLVELLAAAFAE